MKKSKRFHLGSISAWPSGADVYSGYEGRPPRTELAERRPVATASKLLREKSVTAEDRVNRASRIAKTVLRALIITLPFMADVELVTTTHIALSDALLPIAAMIIFAAALTRRDVKLPLSVVAIPYLIIFIQIVGTCVLIVVDPTFELPRALMYVLKLMVNVAMFAVAVIGFGLLTKRDVVAVLNTWVWVALVLSGLSLIWMVTGYYAIPNDGYRALGFFQDGNMYGCYLLLGFVALRFRSAVSPRRFDAIYSTIILLGVVSAGSRSALLVLGVFLLYLTVKSIRKIWRFAALALLTLLGAVILLGDSWLYSMPIYQRFAQSLPRAAEDSRLKLAQRAYELSLEHPLFGVGAGQMQRYTVDIPVDKADNDGYRAHNLILSFLAENGLPAAVIVCAGLCAYFVMVRSLRTIDPKTYIAALLGFIAVFLEGLFLNIQTYRFVWLSIGISIGIALREKYGQPSELAGPARNRGTDRANSFSMFYMRHEGRLGEFQ